MSDSVVKHIFAYGTLQRGHLRGNVWPRKPVRVFAARTRGELYDLGPYPALRHGDDWVSGECWELADVDLAETLQVLDEEEGFANRPDDLYRRETIACLDDQGRSLQAFAYFLVDERLLRSAVRIEADSEGCCRWGADRIGREG